MGIKDFLLAEVAQILAVSEIEVRVIWMYEVCLMFHKKKWTIYDEYHHHLAIL